MNGHYNVGEAARLSNVSAKMVRLSMAEIGELLDLWQNRRRPSASVKRIASDHVTALDAKMAKMAAMRKTDAAAPDSLLQRRRKARLPYPR